MEGFHRGVVPSQPIELRHEHERGAGEGRIGQSGLGANCARDGRNGEAQLQVSSALVLKAGLLAILLLPLGCGGLGEDPDAASPTGGTGGSAGNTGHDGGLGGESGDNDAGAVTVDPCAPTTLLPGVCPPRGVYDSPQTVELK